MYLFKNNILAIFVTKMLDHNSEYVYIWDDSEYHCEEEERRREERRFWGEE